MVCAATARGAEMSNAPPTAQALGAHAARGAWFWSLGWRGSSRRAV